MNKSIVVGMMDRMPLRLSLPDLDSDIQPIVQEVGEELLICDPLSGRVHLLPPQVAMVYRACDGETPASQVAASLGADGERVLAQCLVDLEKAHLIAPPAEESSSRRQFLAGAGVISAALITSISLPYPVAAASGCLMTGDTGCVGAGRPGVDANSRPTGCGAACCGGGGAPCTTCPCGPCQCFVNYRCGDSLGNSVPCSSGGVDICQAGSNDFILGTAVCRQPNLVNINVSCAAARALAATGSSQNYRCCQCP